MASQQCSFSQPCTPVAQLCGRLPGFVRVRKGRTSKGPVVTDEGPTLTHEQSFYGSVGPTDTIGDTEYMRKQWGMSMLGDQDVISTERLMMVLREKASDLYQKGIFVNDLLEKIVEKERRRILLQLIKKQKATRVITKVTQLTEAKYYGMAFLAELRREIKIGEKAAFARNREETLVKKKKIALDSFSECDQKLIEDARKSITKVQEAELQQEQQRRTKYQSILQNSPQVRCSGGSSIFSDKDVLKSVRFNSIKDNEIIVPREIPKKTRSGSLTPRSPLESSDEDDEIELKVKR